MYNNSIYPVKIHQYVAKNAKNTKDAEGATTQDETQERSENFSYQTFPDGKKTTIDYSKSSVNIAQIITDFKATANAIGTNETVSKEVEGYLALIQTESEKTNPNKDIIRSNFKNASKVLDEYISDTLNKPSKVVESWIDALFLQKVDYKSDPAVINPDFKVSLPQRKTKQEKQQAPEVQTQNETVKTTVQTPSSVVSLTKGTTENKLKEMFSSAKKISRNNQREALVEFNKVIKTAQAAGDKELSAMANYEVGKIYDKHDLIKRALASYNNTLEQSDNLNLKTQAHLSMAQIYDDYAYFEPALNHSHSAIALSGEAQNLKGQTKALTFTAGLYQAKYDKENTFSFLDLAESVAEQTNDGKIKGAVDNKIAKAYEHFSQDANALKYYGKAISEYQKEESDSQIAKNYYQAAFVMEKLNNSAKAEKFLNKALYYAQKAGDKEFENLIKG